MKFFSRTAWVLSLIAALFLCGSVYADYQFDDLTGPSGKSYQWMIINDAGDTFGNNHGVAIDVSGDVLTEGDAKLDVLNGDSLSTIDDRSLHTFFVVATDGHAEFDMNFRSPTMRFEAATPNLSVSTIDNENAAPYTDTKTAYGKPDGDEYDDTWRGYAFTIDRNQGSAFDYDTAVQYFYFQQNPNVTPSQGIPRPMIISNVSSGTATDEPLVLRMTLRDAQNANGNIVAYDRDTWYMDSDKDIDNSDQWVFVPVDNLNTDNTRINYFLTTEVVNHTSVRYAAIPYDSYGSWQFPSSWRFDVPRRQGNTYTEREFQLAPLSHIAPGLVTLYRRTYNVNESDKRPLRLFPVDDFRGTGVYDLRLNHTIIYGKRLGDTYKYAASEGNFNLFEITAYQPRPYSMSFYDDIARITGSTKTVTYTTSNLTSSAINRDRGSIPSEAIQYFTVNQTIPGSLRSSTVEGILPLHITLNIPVTMINDRAWWNDMLDIWRSEGSSEGLKDMFADKFEIFLLTETDGKANPWNLTQELMRHGDAYHEQIKVFMDEDRGRITQDNDRGIITVSFIVMLMNGTRDGVRPELSLVPDSSVTQEKEYIVVRDGSNDTKWKMTFFVAPSSYIVNPDPVPVVSPDVTSSDDRRGTTDKGSGGGGGCEVGIGTIAMFLLGVMITRKYEGR